MRATRWAAAVLAIASILATFASAGAADQIILGRAVRIRDPIPPDTVKRDARVEGQERRSTHTIVGDPTVNGATLRIIANGGTPSDQTWTLPASGWRQFGTPGRLHYYRYRLNKYAPDAVHSAEIRRSSTGTFSISATVTGKYGPLSIVPPNPGTDAAMVLSIVGGDTYCTGLGGAAGGLVKNDPPGNPFKTFAVKAPTSELGACPP